jgi:DNA-binding NarL/FixJ family response regulator
VAGEGILESSRKIIERRVMSNRSHSPLCVLVLQNDLSPDLALAASLRRHGYSIAGPFHEIAPAAEWMRTNTPAAAILDVALWDDVSFDLAHELRRRNVPFLFYSAWDDPDQIPIELRDIPFLEKPDHFVLVPRLISKFLNGGKAVPPDND